MADLTDTRIITTETTRNHGDDARRDILHQYYISDTNTPNPYIMNTIDLSLHLLPNYTHLSLQAQCYDHEALVVTYKLTESGRRSRATRIEGAKQTPDTQDVAKVKALTDAIVLEAKQAIEKHHPITSNSVVRREGKTSQLISTVVHEFDHGETSLASQLCNLIQKHDTQLSK